MTRRRWKAHMARSGLTMTGCSGQRAWTNRPAQLTTGSSSASSNTKRNRSLAARMQLRLFAERHHVVDNFPRIHLIAHSIKALLVGGRFERVFRRHIAAPCIWVLRVGATVVDASAFNKSPNRTRGCFFWTGIHVVPHHLVTRRFVGSHSLVERSWSLHRAVENDVQLFVARHFFGHIAKLTRFLVKEWRIPALKPWQFFFNVIVVQNNRGCLVDAAILACEPAFAGPAASAQEMHDRLITFLGRCRRYGFRCEYVVQNFIVCRLPFRRPALFAIRADGSEAALAGQRISRNTCFVHRTRFGVQLHRARTGREHFANGARWHLQ